MSNVKGANLIKFGSKTQVVDSGISPDTSLKTIDEYLKELKSKQIEWAQKVSIPERIALLEQIIKNVDLYKEEWGEKDIEARQIPKGHSEEGISYMMGPGDAGRFVRLLIKSLKGIEKDGVPKLYKTAVQDGDHVTLRVFPNSLKEALMLPGGRAEIHLEENSKLEKIKEYQAIAYKDPNYQGGVSLVLGAGNVSSLSFKDVLHKLYIEKKVVILKIHPVLDYLGGILGKIFEPFIKAGYLKIVMGGAKIGAYVVNHSSIDDIHMTGSDKTFEAIVYGGGEAGQKNKMTDTRLIDKPVTAELGNVTPVIVVPGEWKESDFDYQADNILVILGILNAYSCCAGRVLILPKTWSGSEKLINKISEKMGEAQSPVNYYPGTNDVIKEARACYPDMETHGKHDEEHQPWMFVKGLDPDKPEYAFRREVWATFISQVFIDASSKEEFLEKAVQFANEKLWGTLAASIIIDAKT